MEWHPKRRKMLSDNTMYFKEILLTFTKEMEWYNTLEGTFSVLKYKCSSAVP